MDAVLRTVGLTKRYKGRAVVDDLSLVVPKGEVYGFVGRNGAGKSTAMKMICGNVLPSAGTVELFGKTQAPGATSTRVGAVIEGPGLMLELSGFDNVMSRAIALGSPDPRAATREVIDMVGLSEAASKRAKTYSLGMKQRLGLALALVGGPDLLMLDEPFNGLDPQGVHDIRTFILRLNETRGTTVFISSHVLDQLARMVSRYGVIRDGRLVREMSAEEVEAAGTDYLCITSPQATRALAVLHEAFPQATFTAMPDGDIHAPADISSSEAAAALAAAGIALTGLAVHKLDIEKIFLDLMGSPDTSASSQHEAHIAQGGGQRA